MIQPKERLCELLPDYTELVIKDLEWVKQKLGEVSIGSQAYNDYHTEALGYKNTLLEEGLEADYVDSLMPAMSLDTVHIAA